MEFYCDILCHQRDTFINILQISEIDTIDTAKTLLRILLPAWKQFANKYSHKDMIASSGASVCHWEVKRMELLQGS
jgi:hypothetical protein